MFHEDGLGQIEADPAGAEIPRSRRAVEGRQFARERVPAELADFRLEDADAGGVSPADFHAEFDQPGQHLIRMVGHHLSKVLNGKFFAQEVRRGSLAVGELLRDEDGGEDREAGPAIA